MVSEAQEPSTALPSAGEVFAWRQVELQWGYVWQKNGGKSGTVIPYWSPDIRWKPWLWFGARVGVTLWAASKSKFSALETDLHLDFPIHLEDFTFHVQPALGLHYWSGGGLHVSPGLVATMHPEAVSIFFVAGYHRWNRRGHENQLVTMGFGKIF